jgi:transcriptional regulator with XRE-family HTH domain
VSGPGATYAYISRIENGTKNPTSKALSVIAAKLGVSADYLATGEYHDPLTRLYAVATRRETERLDDLALRAGLLWMCADPDCEWLNREEATRCTACGKLLNPAFRAAMEARST